MDFINKVRLFSNDELYNFTRTFFIRENLGYYVNHKKFQVIESEIEKRKSNILSYALNDALLIINNIKEDMGEAKIIKINRIDFMNKEQLKVLLASIGAAKKNPNISEEETEISSFNEFLGISPENIIICKVTGNSMINANIYEGDSLILDTKSIPKQNEIVVINVNGENLVKRITFNDSKIILNSENEDYTPYEIKTYDEFNFIGIVLLE